MNGRATRARWQAHARDASLERAIRVAPCCASGIGMHNRAARPPKGILSVPWKSKLPSAGPVFRVAVPA